MIGIIEEKEMEKQEILIDALCLVRGFPRKPDFDGMMKGTILKFMVLADVLLDVKPSIEINGINWANFLKICRAELRQMEV